MQRPKLGEEYFVVTGRDVKSFKWQDDFVDNIYFSIHNCFGKIEDAEEELRLTNEWRINRFKNQNKK